MSLANVLAGGLRHGRMNVAVFAEGTYDPRDPAGDPYATRLWRILHDAGCDVDWVCTRDDLPRCTRAALQAVSRAPRAIVVMPGPDTGRWAALARIRSPRAPVVVAVPEPLEATDAASIASAPRRPRWLRRIGRPPRHAARLRLDVPVIPKTWIRPAPASRPHESDGFVVVCPQPIRDLDVGGRLLAGLVPIADRLPPHRFQATFFCERRIRHQLERRAIALGVGHHVGLPAPVSPAAMAAAIADADLALCPATDRPDRDLLALLCAAHVGVLAAADPQLPRIPGIEPGFATLDLGTGPTGVTRALVRAMDLHADERRFRTARAARGAAAFAHPTARPDPLAATLLATLARRAA